MKNKISKDTLLNIAVVVLGIITFFSVYTRILPNINFIKHQFKCEDISSQQKEVVRNFKFSDEISFCSEDLIKDGVNGFYVDNMRKIYIDDTYPYFKETLYHEYSHYLMSKKSSKFAIQKARKSTELNNEELTDLTSIYLLIAKGNEVDYIFSYIYPEQVIKSIENELFIDYIYALLKDEGIKNPDIDKINEHIKKAL